MKDKIEVVAFDADDTLWENEVYFQEFEHQFCDLLKAYQPQSAVSQELFRITVTGYFHFRIGRKADGIIQSFVPKIMVYQIPL